MGQYSRWSRRELIGAFAVGAGLAMARTLDARGGRVPLVGVTRGIADAAAVKAGGFDYIEGGVGSVLMPDKPDEEFTACRAAVLGMGLPMPACNGFLPGSLRLTGPDPTHDAAVAYAATALKRAAQVGVSIIVFGSGGARRMPDGFDAERGRAQFVAFAKRLAPLAEASRVRIALEPLNRKETNIINSVREGAAIVDAVAHPAFRLLADLYHMQLEGEGPASITAAHDRLIHVHVAQVESRRPPMPGGDDFRPYFAALKQIGYQGRVSVEANWGDGTPAFAACCQRVRELWESA